MDPASLGAYLEDDDTAYWGEFRSLLGLTDNCPPADKDTSVRGTTGLLGQGSTISEHCDIVQDSTKEPWFLNVMPGRACCSRVFGMDMSFPNALCPPESLPQHFMEGDMNDVFVGGKEQQQGMGEEESTRISPEQRQENNTIKLHEEIISTKNEGTNTETYDLIVVKVPKDIGTKELLSSLVKCVGKDKILNKSNKNSADVSVRKKTRQPQKHLKKENICTRCKKKYAHKSGLSRHMMVKHTLKCFTCPTCDKTFTRSDSLADHTERFH